MIRIQNDGPALVWTDYWDTPHAGAGYFYLSWNAGTARLLVPDSQRPALAEMATAREVIISRGPWTDQGSRDALEVLFDDDGAAPFALHLPAEQSDRLLPDSDSGRRITVSAWTRAGQAGQWPGGYRRVRRIPWLESWGDHE
jgi:hypothetical protein